jgi:hypothetical protein
MKDDCFCYSWKQGEDNTVLVFFDGEEGLLVK